jgi:methyl-accepting chemotaxis protein
MALSFIHKISMTKKLLFSNLAYGIPVLVLVWLMVKGKNEVIDFAVSEQYGNRYQQPIEDALQYTSLSRLYLLEARLGSGEASKKLDEVHSKLGAAMSDLAQATDLYAKDLQFTDEGLKARKRDDFRYEKVSAAWSEIKKSGHTWSLKEINDRHASLIAGLRGMIAQLGDTSNLVLDPDLDSYYLMDVSLLALPQMQDRVQDIVSFAFGLARKKDLSDAEKTQFAVYAALLKQSDIDRVTGSGQTALNEDEKFYGKSPTLEKNFAPAMNDLSEKTTVLISEINRWASGVSPVNDYANLREKAFAVMEASYSTWHVASQELDVLLEARVSDVKAQRAQSLGLALAALLLAAFASTFLGVSIMTGFRDRLAMVTAKLRSAEKATTETCAGLVDTSQSLSQGATQQASAVQETVATLNEINAMVGRSQEGVHKTSALAAQSEKAAGQGRQKVNEMITSIDAISQGNEMILNQVDQGNRKLEDIVRIINDIGSKTKVINDIVFQTKLLSFNASVEAARAGEAGKGFSVVAEEVGNLAQMSGRASKEISDMLGDSVKKATQIVDESKKSMQSMLELGRSRVETGKSVARECGHSLEEVVKMVGEVSTMAEDMSRAAEESAKGVSEITKAMQQIDQAVLQNSNLSQETARRSRELESQTRDIQSIVDVIETDLLNRKGVASNVTKLPVAQKTQGQQTFKRAA